MYKIISEAAVLAMGVWYGLLSLLLWLFFSAPFYFYGCSLLIFSLFTFLFFADHVREFSCGKLFYRTFHLDEERDALYVGAM